MDELHEQSEQGVLVRESEMSVAAHSLLGFSFA